MLGQPDNWLWMEGGCHLFNVFRDEIAEEEQVLYCTWCSREAKMATARTHLGELNQAIFSRVSAASGDFLE